MAPHIKAACPNHIYANKDFHLSLLVKSVTCSSVFFSSVHVQSSTSTLPPSLPVNNFSPKADTSRLAGLNLTLTSFFFAAFGRLNVTCTSSPFWLHVYPFSCFSTG